ncbi:MAG: 50S ribosomal protein L21 [Eubacteriaceae bacterium]|jgi:large subunit ribosomal protein L21|nr:50S ribosomal protein L21 [Eubacteriaceae bacterium]
MYAVIETGGKQYKVAEGDVITVERLEAEAGEKVVFDKVLFMGEGADAQVGTPYLDATQVFGEVVENGKGKKVIIYKYKSKKDYRKKQGHRQPYSMVEITGIGEDKPKQAKPVEAEEAAPKAEAKADEAAEDVEKAADEQKAPALKSMKKDELIAFAEENNIEIDPKATKAVITEAIEAGLK